MQGPIELARPKRLELLTFWFVSQTPRWGRILGAGRGGGKDSNHAAGGAGPAAGVAGRPQRRRAGRRILVA